MPLDKKPGPFWWVMPSLALFLLLMAWPIKVFIAALVLVLVLRACGVSP